MRYKSEEIIMPMNFHLHKTLVKDKIYTRKENLMRYVIGEGSYQFDQENKN
jgi:hypothetical protein